MLLLGRKVSESILIGDSICVTVTSIQGGQVKIGITAPKEMNIAREEILADDDPRLEIVP